jgi:hypothetical protein
VSADSRDRVADGDPDPVRDDGGGEPGRRQPRAMADLAVAPGAADSRPPFRSAEAWQ